jgi:hypothetical protein
MDAIIRRYKAHIGETGLILKHEAGISFEFTPEETLGLWDFINAYRQTLLSLQRDADIHIARVGVNEHDN